MNIPNASLTPRTWTDSELEEEAQKALEEFVDRRLAEPSGKYLTHLKARRTSLVRLFKLLAGVDPTNPDPAIVRRILLDTDMFDALRYVAGPPVSEDDLGVLVTRRIRGFNRTDIKFRDDVPIDVLQLICKLSDPYRFPWISAGRDPTPRELRLAITATTSLHATQSLQTERRGHGKIVEQRLELRLIELGFQKISGKTPKPKRNKSKSGAPFEPPEPFRHSFPAKGRITQPSHHPAYPYFYGECQAYGRKVDLFIALATGHMIALEAKDSSSGINGKKRILNDTAAKAKKYNIEAGKTIISVALLSGVFKVSDLQEAQQSGLFLVWAHDMDGFIDWIKAQAS